MREVPRCKIGYIVCSRNGYMPYLLLIPHCAPAEVIVDAHSLNIDSTGGGKHYARSDPAYISRTDRL